MKVAMIGHKDFPSRSGGVEVMVGGLARSLVERGYDVTVYTAAWKSTIMCTMWTAFTHGGYLPCKSLR